MAPMRCHILHQLHTEKTSRKITFWYGARSKSEMFYDEEFSELAQNYNNFSYYVALSDHQPEDKWEGLVGFIHQCLYDNYLKTHDDPTEIEYYLCGPPMMIDAIENLLFDIGVESNIISIRYAHNEAMFLKSIIAPLKIYLKYLNDSHLKLITCF